MIALINSVSEIIIRS